MWSSVIHAEPKLKGLWKVALSTRVDAPPGYCANRSWYGWFKPRLLPLVGWERKKGPKWLQEQPAYEVAYDVIWETLPDCKHEGLCVW